MWVPLTLHVMFGHLLGGARNIVLLPAIPATVLLYSSRSAPGASPGRDDRHHAGDVLAADGGHSPLPAAARPEQADRALRAAVHREEGHLLLARHRLQRPGHALARPLGLPAGAGLGVTATLVAYVVGTLFGLLAGYLAGWWDEIISFFANVLLSFPVMVLFIVILNYLGPSGFNIVIAVTFASAPAIMRIVRGLTLDIKTRDYVFAAQTRGESPLYIMIVELLPNARGPIIVDACLRLGYTTVAITTLTFLGLGLQPPDPDWGLMIKESAKTAMLFKFSYMLIIPALSVSSLILGFNLLGRRPARDEPARLREPLR